DHREQQAQIAGDRRLEREQSLNLVLDAQEVVVDLVVERNHLCGELSIPFLECAHRPVDGADNALPHLLKLRLDLLERGVDRHQNQRTSWYPAAASGRVTTSSPPRNGGLSHPRQDRPYLAREP